MGNPICLNSYLLCTETQANLLFIFVYMENSILNFIAPKQLVSLQIFDFFVMIEELSDTSFTNVTQILFGIFPFLRNAYL